MPNEADQLAAACFEVARGTKWVQRPIDADEIRLLAQEFTEIANAYVSEPLEIDVPLITRAVHYLSQKHVMPMGDDTAWFDNMLGVVLEIARPNTGLDDKSFLNDMQQGISSLLNE